MTPLTSSAQKTPVDVSFDGLIPTATPAPVEGRRYVTFMQQGRGRTVLVHAEESWEVSLFDDAGTIRACAFPVDRSKICIEAFTPGGAPTMTFYEGAARDVLGDYANASPLELVTAAS